MTDPRIASTLTPLLADPAIINDMEALSRRGRPAVEAIGAQLAAVVPDLGDTEKQHVGRMVRDILAKRGWTPRRKARVAPGKLFSWGAVYGRAGSPDARSTGGLAAIRAIVARSGIALPSVDEFIAGRRTDWGE